MSKTSIFICLLTDFFSHSKGYEISRIVPILGILDYLCIIIQVYGENICKKHLEKLLENTSGFRAIPEDLVRYGNEFKLEYTK